MSIDRALANEGFGLGIHVPVSELPNVHTTWNVKRYDEDATSWVSGRMDGAQIGRAGFIQPIEGQFSSMGVSPYDESLVDGNLVTSAGWIISLNRLTTTSAGATGATTQPLIATSARIGAGDGTGTAAIGDTDLSAATGSTHRWFQILSSGPTVATNVLSMVSTFGTADGNFAWNEFGIDIGAPTVTSGNTVAACLWNHKSSIAQGTKASGCLEMAV
jgi:hypothetical protein